MSKKSVHFTASSIIIVDVIITIAFLLLMIGQNY